MTQPVPTPTSPFAKLPRLDPTESKRTVLLKGLSGSGKTESALSFPGPLTVIHTDRNFATLNAAVARGVKVDPIPVSSWKDYEQVIVPAIANRELDCQTVVVDTVDFLLDLMWREIQGTRSKLTQPDWGTGLTQASQTTFSITSAAHAVPGRRSYNIVFNCHLKNVTNEDGGLVRIAPALKGAFEAAIENYFDYVLLLEAGVTTTIVGTPPVAKKDRKFIVYTVPPTPLHTCKGGSLPAEVVIPNGRGLYETLWPTPVSNG